MQPDLDGPPVLRAGDLACAILIARIMRDIGLEVDESCFEAILDEQIMIGEELNKKLFGYGTPDFTGIAGIIDHPNERTTS
jgi:hypothetical protein